MQPEVVVVGAGPAGLSAAGALQRCGVRSVVLEKDAEIGARWSNRYDRLRLHTIRRFSGLAHYPLPRTLPRYVTKDQFASYLRDYAARLELDVRLSQEVEGLRPDGAGWIVCTGDGDLPARAVVLATGRYDRPVIPDWPGLEGYAGRFLHSGEYRSGSEYRGHDVLVVGLGNTGAEIAADLVEDGARRVAVAVRTPPPISRRDVVGVPIQVLGLAGSVLPASVGDRLAAVLRRVGTGDLTPYGIGAPEWGPFTSQRPPVIDVGFLRVLRRRRVEILAAVERFTEDGVVFVDGREERFDAVIAATGYRSRLPELLADSADTRPPRLHLVGYRESVRGGLFEIRRESLRVAQAVARDLASAA